MNIFFISDTHFGHEKPYNTFLRPDGSFLRHHGSATAGDEAMVENWNKTVKPTDKVYHVGDFAMHKKFIPLANRLNGEKILIRGNHDIEKASVYLQYFKDVRGSHQFDGVLITHIPVHPDSLGRWGFNIHGHLHYGRVMRTYWYESGNDSYTYSKKEIDPRYFNVSVECINYTPISLEEIKRNKP
jgi:calcineurin-like phosphoesterase family protein